MLILASLHIAILYYMYFHVYSSFCNCSNVALFLEQIVTSLPIAIFVLFSVKISVKKKHTHFLLFLLYKFFLTYSHFVFVSVNILAS